MVSFTYRCPVGLHTNDLHRRTPLHLAVEGNHAKVVSLLLEYGADPNVPDTSTATALMYAEGVGSDEIIDLLHDAS